MSHYPVCAIWTGRALTSGLRSCHLAQEFRVTVTDLAGGL